MSRSKKGMKGHLLFKGQSLLQTGRDFEKIANRIDGCNNMLTGTLCYSSCVRGMK